MLSLLVRKLSLTTRKNDCYKLTAIILSHAYISLAVFSSKSSLYLKVMTNLSKSLYITST